jgi:peptidoglycan/LPS O-acetylase OafA/YrhL
MDANSLYNVTQKPAPYRPELDVLRFVAFFAVFLFHTVNFPVAFYIQHGVRPVFGIAANAALAGGRYGVSLFFVLSSYLITDLLIREKEQCGALDVKFFYLRRILRIWPLYYLLIAASAVFPLFDPAHSFGIKYILPFALLSGNWAFVALGGLGSGATPLWSVSVEEQFYLLWPPIVARLSRRQIIYVALGMILIANLSRIVILVSTRSPMALWANTFAHLDSIAAGILLAILLRGRAPTIGIPSRIGLIACGLICIILRGYFQTATDDSVSWGTTLLGWPVVSAACAAILFGFIGLRVKLPTIQYLGKISYGLYAYHIFCLMVVDKLLTAQHRFANGTLIHAGLRRVLTLALTITISATSYTILEKPFLRLKQRFTRIHSRGL